MLYVFEMFIRLKAMQCEAGGTFATTYVDWPLLYMAEESTPCQRQLNYSKSEAVSLKSPGKSGLVWLTVERFPPKTDVESGPLWLICLDRVSLSYSTARSSRSEKRVVKSLCL
jgi:hypothetical protein